MVDGLLPLDGESSAVTSTTELAAIWRLPVAAIVTPVSVIVASESMLSRLFDPDGAGVAVALSVMLPPRSVEPVSVIVAMLSAVLSTGMPAPVSESAAVNVIEPVPTSIVNAPTVIALPFSVRFVPLAERSRLPITRIVWRSVPSPTISDVSAFFAMSWVSEGPLWTRTFPMPSSSTSMTSPAVALLRLAVGVPLTSTGSRPAYATVMPSRTSVPELLLVAPQTTFP